jgi:hypothetical protein
MGYRIGILGKIIAMPLRSVRVPKGQGPESGKQKQYFDCEKRKNCAVRAITTIGHKRFDSVVRLSTVFSVGI